jgi:hypothetical protein
MAVHLCTQCDTAPMTADVVFIVNGLGLGNSTRCHAVIERLQQQGVKIHVVTSGNGIWYFCGRDGIESITEISSLYYSKKDGKISIANTLSSVVDFGRILHRNSKTIATLLDTVNPALVVTDSEYTFWPAKKRGIPHVTLNNSDAVVAAYQTFGHIPPSIRAQYRFVEYSDYLFHKSIPNLSISPTLDPGISNICSNFRRVGPIVRQRYKPTGNKDLSRVSVTLSGSAFGSQIHLNKSTYPVEIDIIGRDAPDGWTCENGVTYHGKIENTLPILQEADLAVVNGGFSAISEAFYMRKPLVVVPVPRHAEQWVNAKTIEKLGVGVMVSEEKIETGMLQALDQIDTFHAAYDRIGDIPDGAQQAAGILMNAIEK